MGDVAGEANERVTGGIGDSSHGDEEACMADWVSKWSWRKRLCCRLTTDREGLDSKLWRHEVMR